MENEIIFSIIIPVYNTANYLECAFNSILEQHFLEYEVIIVDDGSTDESALICSKYEEKLKNYRYIYQKNAGQASARNAGIRLAQGKYIVFLDSDDYLYPEGLHSLKNAIKNMNNPDLVLIRRLGFSDKDPATKPCKYFFDKTFFSLSGPEVLEKIQSFKDFYFAPWEFVVNRTYLLQKNLFFLEGNHHEDEEWVPRILIYSNNVGFDNSFFYCNRERREGSVSSSYNIEKLFDRIKIIHSFESEFLNRTYPDNVQDIISLRCCKILFGVLVFSSDYKKNKRIKDLNASIKMNLKYFTNGNKFQYKFAYVLCKILGVSFTSCLLNSLRKILGNRIISG